MSIRVQKCADERPAFKGRVIQSYFTFDNLFIIQSFICRLFDFSRKYFAHFGFKITLRPNDGREK